VKSFFVDSIALCIVTFHSAVGTVVKYSAILLVVVLKIRSRGGVIHM